jgi:hypothetical protein
MMFLSSVLLAAVLFETAQNGVSFKVESDATQVNPAKSVFLRLELKTAPDRTAKLPDLRDRVVGFSLAEDFVEEPKHEKDGSTVEVANWRLVPEACAKEYRIRPFVVAASPKMFSRRDDDGKFSFVAGPIAFEAPAAREPVTGEMETDPKKDLPPLSWKLAGWIALALAALAAVVFGAWALVRFVVRKVREHRMSPIERAWVELDRLLQKGLPGRGRYKDFYVELTMVVRRYIQRRYGVRAPNLTTEEFLAEFARSESLPGARACRSATAVETLKKFLESADLVKFAGVEATPEMADAATDSARGYLKDDAKEVAK